MTGQMSKDLWEIAQHGSWQQDAKIRVAFPIAFYTDLSSMIFYNGFCNGKPKTVAAGLPAPGTVNSVKTFKNMFQIFFFYSISGIVDAKQFFISIPGKGYGYNPLCI